MNVTDRAFKAIQAKTKTVEVRANKGQTYGEVVTFTNIVTGESLNRNITKVTLYGSVRELLEEEGCKNTLSSYDANLSEEENIAAGITSIENIIADMGQGKTIRYGEIIAVTGVYAIKLEHISE